VTAAWWEDDDQLLVALRVALEGSDDVPVSFAEIGKASFTWRDIDAELAALTYDSAYDLLAGAATRAEPSAARNMTFEASQLSIELEIIGDVLHGQLVPPQAGEIEIRHADGTCTGTTANDVGYFTATPPGGSFLLHCHTTSDIVVQTGWITL
jgi:hypothetical protein